jgi:uncharacterized RDD family membrane protein YckC
VPPAASADLAVSPPPTSPAAAPAATTASRTTSSDLSDLLAQLGDGTEGDIIDPNAALTDPRDLERPDDVAAVVVESTGAISFDPEFASFGSRAGGWAIDTAITTLALLPGMVLLFAGSGVVRLLAVLLIAVGVGLIAWSYTVAVALSGQWIGNRLMSTTVVNVSNGEFIDQPHAFMRFVVRAIFSPVLFAGFLLALTNNSRRTFHDQAADTIVTRPRRASWSIGDEAAEGQDA